MSNFEKLKLLIQKDRLTPDLEKYYIKELYYLECNEKDCEYILSAYEKLKKDNIKTQNPNNSTIIYLIGLSDKKPQMGITRTPVALPDIDYDTDGRDQIKSYLVSKYGSDKVSLLGTYNTLKTKGAIKDVVRQVRPEISFEEVNKITKKFDLLKRTDYKTEIEFFEATLDTDKETKKWFEQNKDINDAVRQLLGNAKSTGIHAGGIVVSRVDIKEIVPLTYERNEQIWVTQPEMADVEGAGLIKYDFLGLKTLGDLNRCIKLVNSRHGTSYTLSNVPLDEKDILKEFKKGNTTSVFQFNTDLATSILIKLNSVDSIDDLATITSIARPGPLNMGMDNSFINRKNGKEPVKYLHPLLEPILKNTYGIFCYQEQIMQTVQIVGGLSGDESVTVLKGMGKKQLEKILKYKEKFLKYAQMHHSISEELSAEIWEYLQAFAEYGFNRSHAVAYACVSYLCMWFKERYPVEWVAAVLDGADKDDFKIMYTQWNKYIQRPDINFSKNSYYIQEDNKHVVMPFSSINGVGEKAVSALVAAQPFASFSDFFNRIDKRKVNKSVVISLIFAGVFDRFKQSPEMSDNKFRKLTVKEFIDLRHKDKKPAKLEREQDELLIREIEGLNRGQILMKEIGLLNFTAFDYHSYYKDKMTTESKNIFGKEARRPHEIIGYPDKTDVVIGGAIESIAFVPIKTGKHIGKERAIIKLTNMGGAVEVVIFPWTLEKDDSAGGSLRKLVELTPIIVKGQVNIWNGNFSVIFKEGLILA